MLHFVTENRRTNWDTYTVQNTVSAGFLIPTNYIYVSPDMLALMLGENDYRMFAYTASDGKKRIGYGIGDPNNKAGMTEAEAYTAWLEDVKDKEVIFRRTLPLISITQTHYDALFGLYYSTGSWKRVFSDVGIYDLYTAVKAERWLLVADMINDGKVNPAARQREARVLQLADYTTSRTRTFLRSKGIQYAITQYNSEGISESTKRQIETAYYRQTTAFMPGMSELRKRELVNTFGKLS